MPEDFVPWVPLPEPGPPTPSEWAAIIEDYAVAKEQALTDAKEAKEIPSDQNGGEISSDSEGMSDGDPGSADEEREEAEKVYPLFFPDPCRLLPARRYSRRGR